ncbi:MAG: M20/M25/M40 family metallo-hydrolase, partial [Cytophagales bacterium]
MVAAAFSGFEKDLIQFAQDLVRIKSYSGQEEEAIRLVEKKMLSLGFDEVVIDQTGNVLGKIGNGSKSILFDSHVDTVEVNDASEWKIPPFSGEVMNGRLHGRGSVDMKSSVAASVYAAALAKQQGFTKEKTIYVSATVFEEDCDGENLKHLFKEQSLRPDAVVICEPSN